MKKKALLDVSVLLLFFNRPETFGKVFEAVRQARPARLFLYQDGARNEHDLPGIEACREIASHIDWECEVHHYYQERNFGCDPSEYISQRWAFSLTEKCIVLEDDAVPALSFFPFCKEMLDRYENDDRITMISGFNIDEQTTDVAQDYFFTSAFSIWGWASWRRVVSQWEGDYAFLEDEQTLRQLKALVKERHLRNDFIKMCQDHRDAGKEFYESIFWAHMLLSNGLAIMPRLNQIASMSATDNSTHFSSLKTMPRGLRRIFTMKSHELKFPLSHPRYVVEHVAYSQRLYRVHAWGHPWVKVARSFEELFLNLRYGNFAHIGRSIARRLQKWTGTFKHA